MLWGMELSFTEEEILRKYFPILKKYGVYFDAEICNLIENCNNDLEAKIQAFIGWFLCLESDGESLPDANECFFLALSKSWIPSEYQKKRLMEAGLYSFDLAIREKLANINFFRSISYSIPHNSKRIEFFHRGVMIWKANIPEILKVSDRGLIEMYKFRVNQHQENLKQLGFVS